MNQQTQFSNYGLTSAWHFTDASNRSSIEKYGIQSLYNIIALDISVSRYGANDLSHELDRKRGLDKYVHLSFIKDHPMYHIAKKRGTIVTPMWIEIDISVLLETMTRFCDRVANAKQPNIFSLSSVFKYIDFETMLHSSNFYEMKEARKAEIMAYGSINTNLIKGFHYGK